MSTDDLPSEPEGWGLGHISHGKICCGLSSAHTSMDVLMVHTEVDKRVLWSRQGAKKNSQVQAGVMAARQHAGEHLGPGKNSQVQSGIIAGSKQECTQVQAEVIASGRQESSQDQAEVIAGGKQESSQEQAEVMEGKRGGRCK